MKKQVLFVDDEPHVLQGLRRMLRPLRAEWDMAFAASGEQALAMLARQPFDVVVSDMRMPGMDGEALLREVMKRSPRTVRIVLSGQTDKDFLFRTVTTAHQVLAKPCDAETLKSTVERAFGLRDLMASGPMKELTSSMTSLPSLPELYQQVMDELQSPDPSIKRIGQAIENDLAMSAKILQMVNSPYFGFRHQITSASQAAYLLGLEAIRSLVLVVHVFSQFDNAALPRAFQFETLWRHSIRVGTYAQRISREVQKNQKAYEDAFTAGLLHDLGKLVLAATEPARYEKVLGMIEDGGCSATDAEFQVFSATHSEVGAYLLTLWGLPNPIVEAVAYHHFPSQCPGNTVMPLTAVHVANALAHDAVDSPADNRESGLDTPFLREVGLLSRIPEWRRMLG